MKKRTGAHPMSDYGNSAERIDKMESAVEAVFDAFVGLSKATRAANAIVDMKTFRALVIGAASGTQTITMSRGAELLGVGVEAMRDLVAKESNND